MKLSKESAITNGTFILDDIIMNKPHQMQPSQPSFIKSPHLYKVSSPNVFNSCENIIRAPTEIFKKI